nr:hypothetical protein [Tanacetum cinerariifolium]
MSSDNASSAVTYTSISFDSDRPSWGIPLMDVDKLPKMDPYEEIEDQPYANEASPIAELPGHIVDLESMEEDSIDYPDEPGMTMRIRRRIPRRTILTILLMEGTAMMSPPMMMMMMMILMMRMPTKNEEEKH